MMVVYVNGYNTYPGSSVCKYKMKENG